MLSDQVREFLGQTHRGVITTFRRDGGAQMSIVSCGPTGKALLSRRRRTGPNC